MNKILLIEDEEAIRIGLKYCLEQEKFVVYESENGSKSLEILKENNNIDLILLDINLPDINGFDLFEQIKKYNIPTIFLTANDLEVSIVKGLDMGAYDYITKPFKTRELISRINSVIRISKKSNDNLIKIDNLIIDLNQAKVLKNNKDVFLTALEYKILLILATNPNIVFSRDQILANIWDVNEEYVNDNTLTVYIKRIREKIEDDINNPKIVKTVRGLGYKVEI
ncbi:MAG TPA: response regulator transcription factor [Bacilli bacterium]|nr:response regulator transcription factor [Bacilli bacterium]